MDVESCQSKSNSTHNTESDPPLDDIEMVSEVNDEFSSPDEKPSFGGSGVSEIVSHNNIKYERRTRKKKFKTKPRRIKYGIELPRNVKEAILLD